MLVVSKQETNIDNNEKLDIMVMYDIFTYKNNIEMIKFKQIYISKHTLSHKNNVNVLLYYNFQ